MYFENPDILDPDAPVTFGQGKLIALACGGIKNICPGYAEGDSSAESLTAMGLNKGKASKVIEALAKAGLKQANMNEPEKARKATQILSAIGGISCSIPAARAATTSQSRSTGSQAASSASVSRERLAAILGQAEAPQRKPDEEDIEVLMLGRGMTRDQAIRFLRLIGKANPLRHNGKVDITAMMEAVSPRKTVRDLPDTVGSWKRENFAGHPPSSVYYPSWFDFGNKGVGVYKDAEGFLLTDNGEGYLLFRSKSLNGVLKKLASLDKKAYDMLLMKAIYKREGL